MNTRTLYAMHAQQKRQQARKRTGDRKVVTIRPQEHAPVSVPNPDSLPELFPGQTQWIVRGQGRDVIL